MNGIIREADAASVETDLVISSIGLRVAITLLVRSSWFGVS